jgi:hypothetical protein
LGKNQDKIGTTIEVIAILDEARACTGESFSSLNL